MYIQNKLDQLSKRLYKDGIAINILKDIITYLNATKDQNTKLLSRLNGLSKSEYMEEVEKYVTVLGMLGYSQIDFQTLTPEVIDFVSNNFSELKRRPVANDLIKTQQWFRVFQFENNRAPESIKELKEYVDNFDNND